MTTDTAKAIEALNAIPAHLPRNEWVRAGMGAHAAGLDFDAFNDWSAGADNYDARAARDVWHSFKPVKVWGLARFTVWPLKHGWRMGESKPQQRQPKAATRTIEPPPKPFKE